MGFAEIHCGDLVSLLAQPEQACSFTRQSLLLKVAAAASSLDRAVVKFRSPPPIPFQSRKLGCNEQGLVEEIIRAAVGPPRELPLPSLYLFGTLGPGPIGRTLDGSHIGIYENLAISGPPRYGFRDDIDERLQKSIELEVFGMRPEGFEEDISALAQRQLETDGEGPMQRKYDSL